MRLAPDSSFVATIKQAETDLLKAIANAYEATGWHGRGEFSRMRALANTNVQQGVMWALRGLTADSASPANMPARDRG